MTRLFQQRKQQNTGMKDKERAEDIIFQIGQSKAIRNTVANFLQTFTDFMLEEAKKSLIDRFGKDLPGSRERAQGALEDRNIPLTNVEKVIGRAIGEWTAKDLARVAGSLQAIRDGMVTIEDVFPSGDTPHEAGSSNKAPPPPAKKTEAKTDSKPPAEAKDGETAKEAAREPEPEKTAQAADPAPKETKKKPEPKKEEPLVDDSALDGDQDKLAETMVEQIEAAVVDAKKQDDPDLIMAFNKDPRMKMLHPAGKAKVKQAIVDAVEAMMA